MNRKKLLALFMAFCILIPSIPIWAATDYQTNADNNSAGAPSYETEAPITPDQPSTPSAETPSSPSETPTQQAPSYPGESPPPPGDFPTFPYDEEYPTLPSDYLGFPPIEFITGAALALQTNIQLSEGHAREVNYYRIWNRAVWSGGPGLQEHDVNVFTAIDQNTVGSRLAAGDDRSQIFRLVAAEDAADWFYIVSMAYGTVLTAEGGMIRLAERTGDSSQHWRRQYTAQGIDFYQRGAVTHGVYRYLVNRATGSHITAGDALTLSSSADLNAQWNIVPVNYEQMVRGNVPDNRARASWESFAVVYPRRDALNPAGRMRLRWVNANGFAPNVTGYNIYLNGIFSGFVPQSNAEFLTHYFYNVDVAKHTLRVDALAGGGVVGSAEIDYFITKKGLSTRHALAAPEMGVAWYYNWSPVRFPGTEHLEFTPMQWGRPSMANIDATIRNAINQGSTEFLGFNEPDLAVEANIPVDEAVQMWRNSFVPFRNEIRLGAPVTAWPNIPWQHQFMEGIREGGQYLVDFNAFHQYPEFPGFNSFHTELVRMRNNWPDQPIWITELGVRAPADWVWPNLQPNLLLNNFPELMDFMTYTDWIERYVWFSFSPFTLGSPFVGGVGTQWNGIRTTYCPQTGALFPLGVLFREMGNPAGYNLPPIEPPIDAFGTFNIHLPETAHVISGVVPPVAGATAVTNIEATDALVGTVTWSPIPPGGVFVEGVVYTATVRLSPAPGRSYQMGIVSRDFFAVEGAESVINPAGGGIVTATFPPTGGQADVFTVTFRDFDGSLIGLDTVLHGGQANSPFNPVRVGYRFTGWALAGGAVAQLNNVTADMEVFAQYDRVFTVTFRDWNGLILSRSTVSAGGNVAPPPSPSRSGFNFTGWSHVAGNVTADMDIVAEYEAIVGHVPGDLAFMRPAFASTNNPNLPGVAPGNAVNGQMVLQPNGSHTATSFWGPNGGASVLNHWLVVDLGEEFNLSRVEIEWGNAVFAASSTSYTPGPADAMRHFEIQVSNVNPGTDADWTTLATVANPAVATAADRPRYNDIDLDPGSGRFVRIRVSNTIEVYTQWPRLATFRVFGDDPAPPTIQTTSLPTGEVGMAYHQTLQGTSAVAMTWDVVAGTLPNGLSLNFATGVISGTPTASGTFDFTVRAVNQSGGVNQDLSIAVTGFNPPSIANLTFNIPTNHMFNASPQGIGTVTGIVGMGSITVLYNGSTDIPVNAGMYLVTADIAAGTGFGAAVIQLGNYIIARRPLADSMINAIADQTFTGEPLTPIITATDTGAHITPADFTVSHSNNTVVGMAVATMTATGAGNYGGTASRHFNIVRGAAPNATYDSHIMIAAGYADTFDLTAVMLDVTYYGNRSYSLGAFNDLNGILTGVPALSSDGILSFTGSNTAAAGQTATLVVHIATDNFAPTSMTLTFEVTDMTLVNLSGLSVNDIIFGETVQVDGQLVARTIGGDIVNVDNVSKMFVGISNAGVAFNAAIPPLNAGEYMLRVTATGANDMVIVPLEIPFVIGRRTVAITASSHTMYVGTQLPALTATIAGEVAGHPLTNRLATASSPEFTNEVGTFAIIPDTSTDTSGNYTIVFVNGVLSVLPRQQVIPPPPPITNDSGDSNDDSASAAPPASRPAAPREQPATEDVDYHLITSETVADLIQNAIAESDDDTPPRVEIMLEANNDGVEISGSDLQTLVDADGALVISRNRFSAVYTPQQMHTWAFGEDAEITIVLMPEVLGLESLLESMIQIDPFNQILLNDLIAMSIAIDGALINTEGTLITVDLSDLNLTPQQMEALVGIMIDPETGEITMIEGMFSEDGQVFSFIANDNAIFGIVIDGESQPPEQAPPLPVVSALPEVPMLPQVNQMRLQMDSHAFTQDGVQQISDAAPFIDPETDRAMVPLRVITDALGAQVHWYEESRTVGIIRGHTVLMIPMEQPLPNDLGVPMMVNDRVFVPVRYVAEMLGATVEWDSDTSSIVVRL